MAKRVLTKDLDLSKLELEDEFDGRKSTSPYMSEWIWQRYKVGTSETEKTATEIRLMVYYKIVNGKKVEDRRFREYRRHKKYLAINGPKVGRNTVVGTDYALYMCVQGPSNDLPLKVAVHTDSLAKTLGLKW